VEALPAKAFSRSTRDEDWFSIVPKALFGNNIFCKTPVLLNGKHHTRFIIFMDSCFHGNDRDEGIFNPVNLV
jgi:hypothetical protein